MDKQNNTNKCQFKLAFDLIISKVDKNNQCIEDTDQRVQMTTLEEIAVDYSEDIKRVHYEENSLYDDLINLMEDTIVQTKVINTLIKKGLINKDNVRGVDLSLMVWEVEDKDYCEYGYSWVNANPKIDWDALIDINQSNKSSTIIN